MASEKKNDIVEENSGIYEIFYASSDSDNKKDQEFQVNIEHHLHKFTKDEEKKKQKRAHKLAEEINNSSKNTKKKMPAWLDIFIHILVIILILVAFRSFVALSFRVEGASMKPALNANYTQSRPEYEFIYVDKLLPLITGYDRGDIVVLYPPQERLIRESIPLCWYHQAINVFTQKSEDPCLVPSSYIKRVIGIEGDMIEIKEGKVFVTPRRGERTEIPQHFLSQENIDKTCVPARDCQGSGDKSRNFIEGKTYGPVPAGHYFVLGDNRLNSTDSRNEYWPTPFIAREKIVGVGRAVFLSPQAPLDNSIGSRFESFLGSFSDIRLLKQEELIPQK